MHKVKLSQQNILYNTLFLYIRMAFIILVTLYTSRVVLHELGVVDFGIYNLVSGFVVIFSFFGSSLSNSAQRFLNFQYGMENYVEANHVFNVAFLNFFVMSIVVVITLETIGLWFVNNKLVIPPERLHATNILFQFSIVSVFLTMNSYIYDSVIIARERMKVYAYVGMIESIGRLGIALILAINTSDKLVLYAFLYMAITLLIVLAKMIYCFINFPECKINYYWNLDLFKKMFFFIWWNAFTALTEVINLQGISVLLNLFLGPSINAARGISIQMSNALSNFSHNIYLAARPQLIKAYAAQDMVFFLKTINLTTKITYYLLMILAIPLVLNMNYILNIWLTVVPKYTQTFSVLIVIYMLVDSIKNPLWAAAQAVGNLRMYSLVGGVVFLMVFPLSYLLLKAGFPPQGVYLASIVVRIIYLYVIIRVVNRMLPAFDLKKYVHVVIFPIFFVTILAPIAPLAAYSVTDGFASLLLVSAVSVISSFFVIYFVGLSREERLYIRSYLQTKLGY